MNNKGRSRLYRYRIRRITFISPTGLVGEIYYVVQRKDGLLFGWADMPKMNSTIEDAQIYMQSWIDDDNKPRSIIQYSKV